MHPDELIDDYFWMNDPGDNSYLHKFEATKAALLKELYAEAERENKETAKKMAAAEDDFIASAKKLSNATYDAFDEYSKTSGIKVDSSNEFKLHDCIVIPVGTTFVQIGSSKNETTTEVYSVEIAEITTTTADGERFMNYFKFEDANENKVRVYFTEEIFEANGKVSLNYV